MLYALLPGGSSIFWRILYWKGLQKLSEKTREQGQSRVSLLSLHPLFKPQEAIPTGDILGIILSRLRVIFAEEFHNVKTAFVHIEMNVPLLKVRCVGFPYFRFRMQFFDGLPCGEANAFAVTIYIDEEQLSSLRLVSG